jgi:hypothetical protein
MMFLFRGEFAFSMQFKHNLKTLVDASSAIVLGKVSQISPRLEKGYNGKDVIYTFVTITAESVMYGEVDSSITIRMLGGAIGKRLNTLNNKTPLSNPPLADLAFSGEKTEGEKNN